jgi:hypothetical protein
VGGYSVPVLPCVARTWSDAALQQDKVLLKLWLEVVGLGTGHAYILKL